ncbi:hypothetical protein ACVWZ3_005264 [Bradyrhizobium sp. i1.3.6]
MRRTPEATALSPGQRDQADVAGALHMGAAAELDGPAERVGAALPRGPAHRDDADLVAILFAEQRARAGLARFIDSHHACRDFVVLQHHVVGDVLDAGKLFRRDRLRMHEVETQTIRRDHRAALGDVVAEHLAQRLVDEMRCRMVRADRGTPAVIDLELQRGAELQLAALHGADVNEEIAELLLRVGDAELDAALAAEHAGVADLTA